MRIVISACVVLMLSTSALAGSKGSSKGAAKPADEMECDHPEAKTEGASAKKEPGEGIVRGARIDKAPTVSLTSLLQTPERQDGKTVVVEGKVRRACARMGCWMELAEAEKGPGVRVTFKDYGFFVPTDSAGARAKVQGTVKVAQLSAEQAEHLRAEGGSMPAGT